MVKKCIVSPVLISLSLAFFVLSSVEVDAEVPPVFILGDSTADIGTNTHLPQSPARADVPFNGIDYPHSRPTGSPPSFLYLQNQSSRLKRHATRGINFASGGSGILDKTGQLPKIVSLSEQIQQFAMVQSNLTVVLGAAETEKLLSRALFFISIGSNDIFGYFFTNSTIPKQEFINTLAFAYGIHLKVTLAIYHISLSNGKMLFFIARLPFAHLFMESRLFLLPQTLYNLGARKFGIISVPPIGCCPSQRVKNTTTNGCLEGMNDFARTFYSTIHVLLRNLSSQYPGMKYSLGNAYEMTINVIEHPQEANFTEVSMACCGAGTLNGEAGCTPKANLCNNRHEFLFWDLFHPTQAAAKIAAFTLYNGDKRFVTPINFKQLAEDC
ncbi:GDSL lipase/esterase [Dillenia turbinata]|uniref:GDSL lipase/esterase n=1 Tax=Dillenia turbinata TaxID=194707 RepID=A0AAN8UJP1_9MAGN